MRAGSRNIWVGVVPGLWPGPDLACEALIVSIVVSTNSLIVEELVLSAEVLEEFELEVRKAEVKRIVFTSFLAYYSEVCAVQRTNLDDVLVFVVVLSGCSEASYRVCNHETCLYARPLDIVPVGQWWCQIEKLMRWNDHLSAAVTTEESAICSSIHEIRGIFFTNIVNLHLKLLSIDWQIWGSLLLSTQLIQVLIFDYYNLLDEVDDLSKLLLWS